MVLEIPASQMFFLQSPATAIPTISLSGFAVLAHVPAVQAQVAHASSVGHSESAVQLHAPGIPLAPVKQSSWHAPAIHFPALAPSEHVSPSIAGL
jgi:C4-dicarboxylate transporter